MVRSSPVPQMSRRRRTTLLRNPQMLPRKETAKLPALHRLPNLQKHRLPQGNLPLRYSKLPTSKRRRIREMAGRAGRKSSVRLVHVRPPTGQVLQSSQTRLNLDSAEHLHASNEESQAALLFMEPWSCQEGQASLSESFGGSVDGIMLVQVVTQQLWHQTFFHNFLLRNEVI
jgi:hypothetical protein